MSTQFRVGGGVVAEVRTTAGACSVQAGRQDRVFAAAVPVDAKKNEKITAKMSKNDSEIIDNFARKFKR